MTVAAHDPHYWFLLEEDGALYLDGRYAHSFVEYGHPMRLTAPEAEAYRREGHEAVQRLYDRVQATAPVLRASTSPYKGRRVSREVSDRMHAAVMAWKAETGP